MQNVTESTSGLLRYGSELFSLCTVLHLRFYAQEKEEMQVKRVKEKAEKKQR